MKTAPVLFVSHGAPTFALEPGVLGPALAQLGQQLTKVKAILVLSPHWQTRGVSIMTTSTPKTIHDFGGFSEALYSLQYPATGHPQLATQTAQRLTQAGWTVSTDEQRGLDHGAWVPLRHLLPQTNIPVFQVSMPINLNTQNAFKLGQDLYALREHGVMIVTSGGMTHNLYEFRHSNAAAQDYAVEFSHWVREAVVNHDIGSLLDYRQRAPHAQRAHPTEEHFLPLLIALGALGQKGSHEITHVIDAGMTHGVLSMESYVWGMTMHTTHDALLTQGVLA